MSSRSLSMGKRRKQTSQRALKLHEFSGMLWHDGIGVTPSNFQMKIISQPRMRIFLNDDEKMNMFFLKTLPEKLFLPKKGKPQGNESDGIADLGWAQQADCANSGLGVPLKLRVKGEKTRGRSSHAWTLLCKKENRIMSQSKVCVHQVHYILLTQWFSKGSIFSPAQGHFMKSGDMFDYLESWRKAGVLLASSGKSLWILITISPTQQELYSLQFTWVLWWGPLR